MSGSLNLPSDIIIQKTGTVGRSFTGQHGSGSSTLKMSSMSGSIELAFVENLPSASSPTSVQPPAPSASPIAISAPPQESQAIAYQISIINSQTVNINGKNVLFTVDSNGIVYADGKSTGIKSLDGTVSVGINKSGILTINGQPYEL
jgi:hypothetical protein